MKTHIGKLNGVSFMLVRDKLGNQQACDDKHASKVYYFAYINSEYHGHFKLMREAMAHIRAIIYNQ